MQQYRQIIEQDVLGTDPSCPRRSVEASAGTHKGRPYSLGVPIFT